jgi:hypothetical protein
MGFSLKCSECKGKFRWDGAWPNCCPLCGVDMSLPDDNVISMPALRSAVTSANDKLYRDMEKGSEHRMHLAAEAAGVPASEMSHLKITNMRDNTRPGEIAAMEDPAPARRLGLRSSMDAFKGGEGFELGAGIASGAVNVNGQVFQGVEPRAGANAMSRIKRQFGA